MKEAMNYSNTKDMIVLEVVCMPSRVIIDIKYKLRNVVKILVMDYFTYKIVLCKIIFFIS
jgi:hypothetical protein